MADQHTRTTPKQSDKTARQSKPKPMAPAPVVESAALQRALDDPLNASPEAMLAVQKYTGNRAVSRLIQTKLTVGPAGDRYEQEADQVAEQVMTMPLPAQQQPALQRAPEEEEELQMKPLAASITPLVQRTPEEEELQMKPLVQRTATPEEEELQTKPIAQRSPEEEDELQAKPDVQRAASGTGFEVSGNFEEQLAASRGGGSPLPDTVRDFMEPRFGSDFSGVRIHTGSQAAQLNRSVSAQAFTLGQDIYLGEGKNDLESSQGKSLLAHELTHVVQQTGQTAVHRHPKVTSGQPQESLQRTLAFGQADLKGDLTLKAKAAGFFGNKSTWAQIQQTLKSYWADSKHPLALLMKLDMLADQWLARHGSSSDPNDQVKKQSLTKLKTDILAEYASQAPTATAALPAATPPTKPLPPTPAKPLPSIPTQPLPPIPAKPLPPIPTKLPKPLPPLPTKPPTPTPSTAASALSDAEYLDKINTGGFKWLSEPSKAQATQAVDPSLLATPGKDYNKLSAAEVAAIRVYTAADYMYINPALVGSEGYLKGSLNASKGEVQSGWSPTLFAEMQNRLSTDPKGLLAEMGKEGLQHSDMAIQGLKKLPPVAKRLKRGERWTEQEYKDRYQRGKVDVRKSFTSVSTNSTVAVNFARQAVSPQRGVVLDLDIKDGREINELSVYYDPSGGEGEILLLPGTEFTVKNVDDPAVKTSGILNVELEQTK